MASASEPDIAGLLHPGGFDGLLFTFETRHLGRLRAVALDEEQGRPEQQRADTDGHGIVGMRERTALLGGSFDAAAADGLFCIRARLPYDGGERRRS